MLLSIVRLILVLVIFLLFLLVSSIVFAVVFEDGNARLVVEPGTATIRSDGFYYQYAELCSKVGSSQSLSLAFLFQRRLDCVMNHVSVVS